MGKVWSLGQKSRGDVESYDEGRLKAAEEEVARLSAANTEAASNALSNERALNEWRDEVENKSRGLDKRLAEVDQREQALAARERKFVASTMERLREDLMRKRAIEAREEAYAEKELAFTNMMKRYEAINDEEGMGKLLEKESELAAREQAFVKREEAMMELQEHLQMKERVLTSKEREVIQREQKLTERESSTLTQVQAANAISKAKTHKLLNNCRAIQAQEQDLLARNEELICREQAVVDQQQEIRAREQMLVEQLIEMQKNAWLLNAQQQALLMQMDVFKQEKATFDELQGQRLKTAICPQCQEPSMCPPIRLCLNGHGFCDNCWMSQMVTADEDKAPVFCPDCKNIGESKLLEAHRFACPKRYTMCLVDGPNCRWTGFYEDVVLHTEDVHLDRHYVGATQEFLQFNNATTAHLISTYNELFLFTSRYSSPPERNHLYAVVQHIAVASRQKRFAYKFELLGYGDGEDSMVFRRDVLPDYRKIDEIFLTGECVSVAFKNEWGVKPFSLDCRLQIARR